MSADWIMRYAIQLASTFQKPTAQFLLQGNNVSRVTPCLGEKRRLVLTSMSSADAHSVRSSHCAQNVVHTELRPLTDSLCAFIAAPSPRDDSQALGLQVPQLRNYFFGQSVGE
jgi:hypothetical protein